MRHFVNRPLDMLTNIDHLHLVFRLSNAKCISYPTTIVCLSIWGWDIFSLYYAREGKYSKSVLREMLLVHVCASWFYCFTYSLNKNNIGTSAQAIYCTSKYGVLATPRKFWNFHPPLVSFLDKIYRIMPNTFCYSSILQLHGH